MIAFKPGQFVRTNTLIGPDTLDVEHLESTTRQKFIAKNSKGTVINVDFEGGGQLVNVHFQDTNEDQLLLSDWLLLVDSAGIEIGVRPGQIIQARRDITHNMVASKLAEAWPASDVIAPKGQRGIVLEVDILDNKQLAEILFENTSENYTVLSAWLVLADAAELARTRFDMRRRIVYDDICGHDNFFSKDSPMTVVDGHRYDNCDVHMTSIWIERDNDLLERFMRVTSSSSLEFSLWDVYQNSRLVNRKLFPTRDLYDQEREVPHLSINEDMAICLYLESLLPDTIDTDPNWTETLADVGEAHKDVITEFRKQNENTFTITISPGVMLGYHSYPRLGKVDFFIEADSWDKIKDSF